MGWNTAFLVLGIIAGILGIWNLARQRNIFLSLTGILWFLVVLFRLPQLEKIYNYELASGVPVVGNLVLFLVIPIFIIFAFFTSYRR
jgi:tetrahydromethanopterin S-methyltransferase subunit C